MLRSSGSSGSEPDASTSVRASNRGSSPPIPKVTSSAYSGHDLLGREPEIRQAEDATRLARPNDRCRRPGRLLPTGLEIQAQADEPLGVWAERFRDAGRLTLNFHPDRVGRHGLSVAASLLASGRYQSQWTTFLSAGSRSAVAGGDREGWESRLFGGAYDTLDPSVTDFPVYGSFDLMFDPHGGSPRFGSSAVVLRRHVFQRTTLCVGDSHMGPMDVGTIEEPGCILAGLAEQAARQALLNRGLGLDELLRACEGHYHSVHPSRDLDGYIEAQVHGGVSMGSDVEAVLLDPSFRGTQVEADLAAAAERHGLSLSWHGGSEIHVEEVPDDFRGPTMPHLARQVARPDSVVDARAIGARTANLIFGAPTPQGDPIESEVQQLKYLWHTLLAHGHDAVSDTTSSQRV